MVKKAPLVLFCLILLVSLTTCDFLFLSMFPYHLSLVQASSDLGDSIDLFIKDQPDYWSSDLFVMKNRAGKEYVFLLVRLDFSPRKKLYVLNPDLEVIARINDDTGDMGDTHLVDANDNFIIGRTAVGQDGKESTAPVPPSNDGQGFGVNGVENVAIWTSWSMPNMLFYKHFGIDWSDLGSPPPPVIGPDSYELRHLSYDPENPLGQIILYLETQDTDTLTITIVPENVFVFDTFPAQILDTYPYFQLVDVDYKRLHYTQKEIIVQDHNSYYHRYNLDSDPAAFGQLVGNFYLDIQQDTGTAIDINGEFLYYFGQSDKILYKVAAWW